MTEAPNDENPEAAHTPYRQCAEGYTRLRIHVSYDGTDFAGWQRQTSQPSVQGTLETAISKIAGEPIRVLGASRTDAGVHAREQTAHFDFPRDPSQSSQDFRYQIQCLTPHSLVPTEVFIAPRDFHAIAVVTDKIYKYRVWNRRAPSAIQTRYTHWVRYPLDLDYLNEASQFFVGKQDFKSFQSAGTPVQTTIRTISKAFWERLDEDVIEFTIQGDGFLKQMVRNIVGTLIDMNQSSEKPEKVREYLAYLDRRKSGPTAPAQGLFLWKVNYPESVDNRCRKL